MSLVNILLQRVADQTPETVLWAKLSQQDWVAHLKVSRADRRIELLTDVGSVQAGVVALLVDLGIHIQVSRAVAQGVVQFSVQAAGEARWKEVNLAA